VEWRREAVRWFDHWLKGVDTGIVDEPAFSIYMRDYHPPEPELEEVGGYWRDVEQWPAEQIEEQTWYAQADGGFMRTVSEPELHHHEYGPTHGLEGGGPTMWWGSIPPDQQPHDDHCLVYDSEPLAEKLGILGLPKVSLPVTSTSNRANWVVRLSDVAPDGQVTQVAGAAINGCHRNSACEPEDLVPGEEYLLEFLLYFTSWVFPVGHRIRLTVSNSCWPMLWPSREPMSTTLAIGGEDGARIVLPVTDLVSAPEPDFRLPDSDETLADGFESLDAGNITGYAGITEIEHNPETGEAVGVATNANSQRYPWGIETFEESIEFRTSDHNPAVASSLGVYAIEQQLEDRTIRFEQETLFTSDFDDFHLKIDRRVLIDDEVEHEKTGEESVPRDFQ
jgi:hypothetical protein